MKSIKSALFYMLLVCLLPIFTWGQTNFYYDGSGNGNDVSNWWTNTDGTGTNPINFTTANQVFNVQNNQNLTFSSTWTVSGLNSKVAILSGGTITSSQNHSITLKMESTARYIQSGTYTNLSLSVGEIHPQSIFQLRTANLRPSLSYGSLEISDVLIDNAGSLNLTGDLIISNSGTLRFGTSSTNSIGGNITINSGTTLNIANNSNAQTFNISGTITNDGTISAGGSGLITINLNGNNSVVVKWGVKTATNHNVNIASTKSVEFSDGFSLGVSRTLTVNGILGCSNQIISGQGSFILSTNATLRIGSDAGISASGTTGNIQVSGTRTFNAGANYVYNGTMSQVTGNGLPGTISGSLSVSNNSDINLTQPTTINGILSFNNGKIILNNNDLTIGSSGSITGSNTANYVVTNGSGRLKRNNVSNTATLFPVGNSTEYTPVTITNAGTIDNFSVLFSASAPGCLPASSAVNGTWDISEDVTGGSNCTISIDYGNLSSGVSFDENDATIGHCTGSVLDYSNGTAVGSLVTGSGFTNFSPFGIAAAAALPIELLSFNAQKQTNSTLLSFSTASERNNERFEIERSADGRRFEVIGTVKGAGDSQETLHYQFSDLQPLRGLNYYRLKQVDTDGAFSYSPVVSVQFGTTNGLSVFPTPATETMNVRLETSLSSDAPWQVIDMGGRVLLNGLFEAEQQDFQIPVSTLNAGAYVLRITAGNGVLTQQFRKQ